MSAATFGRAGAVEVPYVTFVADIAKWRRRVSLFWV
jgi:hypothetical protein